MFTNTTKVFTSTTTCTLKNLNFFPIKVAKAHKNSSVSWQFTRLNKGVV